MPFWAQKNRERERERPKTNILFCNLLTLSLFFLSLENAFNVQIRREKVKEKERVKTKNLKRNVSFLRSGVGNKNERKDREIKGESAKISERQFIKYICCGILERKKKAPKTQVLVVR